MTAPTAPVAPNPRALRELHRDIARIPEQGDFSAGQRLRSLLRKSVWASMPHPAPWSGILIHRSFGIVDLKKDDNALVVTVRATGDTFNLRWHGRRWDL